MAERKAEFNRHRAAFKMTKDVEELKTCFRIMDADDSGTVTRGELKAMMEGEVPDAESVVQILMALGDTNDDGVLSMDEWVELVTHVLPG